jgi:class 3 adenylate cyclase
MDLAREVGAEEWHRLLDRFFALLGEGVHRFEGTVNQYTGDGVMALFGAPLALEDHAQRACHAALWLRRRLRDFAAELRRRRGLRFAVRMGLNSGEVIVGRIGDDLRLDYTAQGHTVGVAARMEQSARANQILLSAQTAALVGGYFALADLGERRVKGVDGPVRVYALGGAGPARTRLEVAGARGLQTFRGRWDELARLRAARERALAGYGQVVSVVGEAGLGKSRLCGEFIDECRSLGLTTAVAHCPPHGRSLPCSAAADLVRDWFGVRAADAPRVARQRANDALRRLGRALLPEQPLVLELLGLAARGAPPAADPMEKAARLATLLQRLAQTQSAAAPLVLFVDDAHWLDPESDAALGGLADAVGWTRTLLLLNHRPDYTPAWERGDGTRLSYAERLDLGPLQSAVTAEMLGDLLGDGAETLALRQEIADRAAGNPYFLEEMVASLGQQGLLRRKGDAWRSTADLTRDTAAVHLPATIHAILAARIDRLGERDKLALQAAAVIGRRFGRPLLRATLEQLGDLGAASGSHAPLRELDDVVGALEEVGLLFAGAGEDGDVDFRHPLAQEVAYHTQLTDRRQRVHQAVALALESLYADRLGQHAAAIAHHWNAAGRRGQAGLWRWRAALNVTTIQKARERPKGPAPDGGTQP